VRSSRTTATSAWPSTATPTACFWSTNAGELIGGDIVTALVGIDTVRLNPGAKILYNLICSRSVPEAVERAGGVPVRSQVGHSFIKKTMRDENIPFGGEHSGHFYFKRNWFADSGMIALMQCLNVFSPRCGPGLERDRADRQPLPLGRNQLDGRRHSGTLQRLRDRYRDAAIDELDGVTIQYPGWWMNVRPSNTEPLLRLNVEGDTRELMERNRDAALAVIRE